MKVISRTSVERFRDTTLPLKAVAGQLGVTRILEGGVQRAGDRVRITVQLIDAATDTHLWAENYDRQLTAANIFAIQSEVATAIAAAMQATLTATERSRVQAIPTRSLEAWESYQLGQQRMANRNSADMAQAQAFFRKAIDQDPKFAQAHAGLAVALALLAHRGSSHDDGLARADRAVAAAMNLDTGLAEAWAASGLIAETRFEHDRAEKAYRRAIDLNPNYANAYLWLGVVLSQQGRYDEARVTTERAVALDPLSLQGNGNLGGEAEAVGRFDEAEARYRKVIEIDPNSARGHAYLGHLEAYARNRFARAVPLMARAATLDPGNPWLRTNLASLYFHLHDDDQATRIIAETRARWRDDALVLQTIDVSAVNRGDAEASPRSAEALLQRNPRDAGSLRLLRNRDARAGQYAAARRRYAAAFPELLAADGPRVDSTNFDVALDLALVLQNTGETERAHALLDGVEACIRTMPRLGVAGYEIADVQALALRGR
jgi:tetratricopeptide (TPR) repeat protein